MSGSASAECLADAPPVARDVARGVSRFFFRADRMALCEVPLGNSRRADIMALDGKGRIVIVEIKVSRADLLGDGKWPEYLDYCDSFYWAVPPGFDLAPFETEAFRPDLCGLIVADRYDAAIVREAPCRPLAAARRKAETLRFARRAARRVLGGLDPDAIGWD
ncbi:MmcB family DNA repair protein [Sphingomonas morindae]|uniref:MmcB family DNA repair protein n=1 Tax=Sphingomonas morindae TaxID=1541170 RepID=A0ABY4XB91_9SPHN|nr:MmcB family DNA repair protein [Sphingomonas morindae]USI74248.1 MmcB family DNA repair protein [Sphingomonas morindae]